MSMQTRRFLEVDSRGRVSLAKFGYRDTQLLAVQHDDGRITLEEVVHSLERNSSISQIPSR